MHDVEDAKKLPCPLGRTFATTHANCIADGCPLWRWKQKMMNVETAKAIGRVARELAEADAEARGLEKPKTHMKFENKATSLVCEDPAAYGVEPETRGWCGLGGKPEVMK